MGVVFQMRVQPHTTPRTAPAAAPTSTSVGPLRMVHASEESPTGMAMLLKMA